MLTYPSIDPIAIHIGSVAIRWYSLAYVGGILLGWWIIAREHAARPLHNLSKKALDDTIVWAVIGIILGGRLGYVFFYKPDYYLSNLSQILHVWEGGMSFHGGLVGFILAFYLFARRHRLSFLSLMDLMACVAPIGIGLGRLANFINGELWGRITDAPWGMVFPHAGDLPRHPSQLYEAALEGAVLFAVMMWLLKRTRLRDAPGKLSGAFMLGYGLARMVCEHFREPDAFLGFIAASITMGQLLSLPMLAMGMYLLLRKSNVSQNTH